ncbi:hypothetical protein JCM8547_006495 [Rhodosporidiobolus lusitaniae]
MLQRLSSVSTSFSLYWHDPPSPAPPSLCHLFLLPDELLEHIVELTEPKEITAATYRPRQNTLLALSLTSKRLSRIAQPFLARAIHFRARTERDVRRQPPYDVEKLKDRLELGSFVQMEPRLEWTRCSALREVRLSRLPGVDLRWLGDLPFLWRLVLNDCHVTAPFLCLPSLVELVCEDVSLTSGTLGTIITTELLPRLRILSLAGSTILNFDHLDPTLARQLDVLSGRSCREGHHIDGLDQLSGLLLVEAFVDADLWRIWERLLRVPGKNLLLYPPVMDKSDEKAEYLVFCEMIPAFLTSPILLERLYLSSVYLNRSGWVGKGVERLDSMCQVHGIKVEFVEVDTSFGGSRMPPSFLRFAKEVKRRRLQQG